MQYLLNSRSYNNRQTLKSYQKIFHNGIQILSLTFPLNFQLINFPLYERILLYFSCPRPYNVCNGSRLSFIYLLNSHHTSPMLSFFAVIKTFPTSPGGIPGNFCWGSCCAAQFFKSCHYFRPKKCYRPGLLNPYPFSDLVEV